MPNHVTNKLTVRKGTQKILPALYSATIEYNSIDEKLYDILRNFSFKKIIGEPKATIDFGKSANLTEWRWDNWGTRKDAFVTDFIDEWQNKDKTVNLINSFGEFESYSSPPLKVVRKLQKRFPDYSFALDYVDGGLEFCGTVDSKGEDEFSKQEKDLRYYGAYLLRESHKDLDQFFEDCEYDDDGNVKDEFDKFMEKNS